MNWNYNRDYERTKNYKKLLEYITSDENKDKWELANEYLYNLDNLIKEQDKKIKEFNNFFHKMNWFLKNAT